MTTIELELDESTLDRARRVAEARHLTLEALLGAMIENVARAEAIEDSILGMFGTEPELIDAVVADTMAARTRDPLRVHSG